MLLKQFTVTKVEPRKPDNNNNKDTDNTPRPHPHPTHGAFGKLPVRCTCSEHEEVDLAAGHLLDGWSIRDMRAINRHR